MCLGITPEHRYRQVVHDVVVVGAGPAGLATAVYAASEGLSVLVLDQRAVRRAGRRVGADRELSRLSDRHFRAARWPAAPSARRRSSAPRSPFRSRSSISTAAARRGGRTSRCGSSLTDGRSIYGRTVVVASGARYRQPNIPNVADFEGAGVSYWASAVEAKLCEGEEIALVGGGNSAGQAVVFLAPKVKHLHIGCPARPLEATMSRYLIDRIKALPNVSLYTGAEVIGLEGDDTGALAGATFRGLDSGDVKSYPLRHLFLFIGADPNAGWLAKRVAVDSHGFVITGREFAPTGYRAQPRAAAAGNQHRRRVRDRRRARRLDQAGRRGDRRGRRGGGADPRGAGELNFAQWT